jgi:hypothetical protein
MRITVEREEHSLPSSPDNHSTFSLTLLRPPADAASMQNAKLKSYTVAISLESEMMHVGGRSSDRPSVNAFDGPTLPEHWEPRVDLTIGLWNFVIVSLAH